MHSRNIRFNYFYYLVNEFAIIFILILSTVKIELRKTAFHSQYGIQKVPSQTLMKWEWVDNNGESSSLADGSENNRLQ